MNLQNLNDQLAKIRADQSAIASKLGGIGVEKFEIDGTPTKAARIAAAENHLIDQLAARELGDPCDVPAAEKALDEAKALPEDFATAARLRVLETMRARHEAEHQDLHEKGVALIEQIRLAEIGRLTELAAELVNDAETAIAETVLVGDLIDAVRSELNARGTNWPFEPINEQRIAIQHRVTPNQARAEVLRALAA